MSMRPHGPQGAPALLFVYTGLALFAAAVYIVVVIGGGALIGARDEPHLGLSLLATLLLAVLLDPVRRRLRALVLRVLHRVRATPYETLSGFADRVSQTYATQEVLPRITKAVVAGTGARRAEVWLAADEQFRLVACEPARAAGDAPSAPGGSHVADLDWAAPIKQGDEVLGSLVVTMPDNRSMQPVEERLLRDLAAQAGIVLSNVRLTADLEGRLAEVSQRASDLRESRARIVALQDAERRRLERDIHDGAQQHLVALAVQLRLAQVLLARAPEKAATLLTDVRDSADAALETLRILCEGIYPPDLVDHGIATALRRQQQGAAVPITVHERGLRRYSADIEVAVYFACLEAVQNAAKHAGASLLVITLEDDGDTVRFTVADDGNGFDTGSAMSGTGLGSMNDRLVALGGFVSVVSEPGAGTTVTGVVPVLNRAFA